MKNNTPFATNMMRTRELAIERIRKRAAGTYKQFICNPAYHESILLKIISEKPFIGFKELYKKYLSFFEGKPRYSERSVHLRLKKLRENKKISRCGHGCDVSYTIIKNPLNTCEPE